MSAAASKCLNIDEWGSGLRFGVKALNTKTVARAEKPADVLPVCLAHNLRQGNQAHRHRSRIDPSRTHMNEVWAGPDRLDVAEALVCDTLESLGIVPKRRDAIMGVEMVFQPPHGVDLPAFWRACLQWAQSRFEHIVSAAVHHDQKRPHMHVLALAISGGRLAGNEMTASPHRPKQRRADFMAYIRRTLGLRPDRKVKTLADLAVSTGKGPKTRAAADRRDAALVRSVGKMKEPAEVGLGVHGLGGSASKHGNPHSPQPPVIAQLSRAAKVALLWALIADLNGTTGVPISAPVLAASSDAETPLSTDDGDTVRVRDDDMPADCWDTDTGTFKVKPAPQAPQKAAAQAWVSAALQNIKGKPSGVPCEQ